MEHNMSGFDFDNTATSRILRYCGKCGDQFQVGARIEGAGDILWWGVKCPSCGTEFEHAL